MNYLDSFKESKALLEGHFLLTSGLHSPNYFQCAKALQYPKNLELFSEALVFEFKNEKIDVVISPAVGGIVLGTEIGRRLKVRTIFAERENGQMKLRRGFEISENENVLVVEDVVTTGGSVKEVIEVAKAAGANIVGAAYIIDRSNGAVRFDVPKQVSLAKVEVIAYKPEDCPLCKTGSVAIKPGSRTLK
jgi:orotate phosphoribosyltransferase